MLMTTDRPLAPISSAMTPEDFERISRRALEIAHVFDERLNRYYAEIVPDVSPAWHVVVVSPGCEPLALDDLTKRRFGVYDAMFDERVIVRGRLRTRQRRVLPGYLLVYVWDVERHWQRIADCNGVADILCHVGSRKPAVVPDEFVHYLQAKELSKAFECLAGKMTRKQRRALAKHAGPVVFSPRSHMGESADLAAQERIALFNRAIGLGL